MCLVVEVPALLSHLFDLQPYGSRQPEVIQGRWTEVGDDLASLPHGLPHEMQELIQILPLLGGVGRPIVCKSLQVLVGGGDHLGETVVHLVRHTPPLALLSSQQSRYKVLQPTLAL